MQAIRSAAIKVSGRASRILALVSVWCLLILGDSQRIRAQEDDYEFMPARGWAGLSETGDDDASSRLAEGFEGLDHEPGKDVTTEPVDGAGGFDNVAPRLGSEEGPGGLDWDPSPSYRTRYKGGTDYTAGSGKRIQGNNWFSSIPYVVSYSNNLFARFDANTYRIYTISAGTGTGQLGNAKSKVVESGSGGSRTWKIYDTRGKTYTFEEASPASGRLTKLEGLGGAQITISYSTNITILQKPSASANNELRRFTYYLNGAQTRLDKIEIEEKVSGAWTLYRKIDFTYFEDVASAVEGASGDLVEIKEETLLSPTSTWLTRKHVFKYFTGTFNSSTNPGYPYQVKAALGPQSVHDWEVANSGVSIHTKTAAQLSANVDRTYTYHSDKRVKEIDYKSSCGCGGGEGLYAYAWDVNGTPPTNMNTWSHRVTITLPSVNGSSRIVDFNKYGQRINSIVQEVAGNSGSRRWIQTWAHDTTGRLTDSYSVKACTGSGYGYNDSTHVVTTRTDQGQWLKFTYDSNNALDTVKLRDPADGDWNLQRKKIFSFLTSGGTGQERRRFYKTSDTVYRSETTTDTGGDVTTIEYTYHTTTDALAVKSRRTVLPAIATADNGSNTSFKPLDHFEPDGRLIWSRDADGFIHFTAYDTGANESHRRVVLKRVVDVNTSSLPSGVPSPPAADAGLPGGDSGFVTPTGGGLNIVTDWTYDALRRPRIETGPAFNAWTGSAVASVSTTKQWYYTRLSGGEQVTVAYDHLDGSYYHHALALTVMDYDGHVVTSALGRLTTQNTSLSDDIDTADSTLSVAFNGTLVRRTDYTYDGTKVTKEEVWSEASNPYADRYTTDHVYDASGRRLTTKAGNGKTGSEEVLLAIRRWSHDVLGRVKTEKLGTVDGGGSDNMTLVEERFYDGEETTSSAVGDGTLTRENRYTQVSGTARQTNSTYDYRTRLTQVSSPGNVLENFTYTNRNQIDLAQRFDATPFPPTLLAQMQHFYDAWGQEFRIKEFRVPLYDSPSDGDSDYDYAKTEDWRNGRGLVVKRLSQGKVFDKTQYDGAGRVKTQSVSYDSNESASPTYSAALDLGGDTVIEETRYVLDNTGGTELLQFFQRNHDGTGTGALDGSSGNARAQYTATWHDKLHRRTHTVNYGTYGGSDLVARPTGNPPSGSASDMLVTRYGYYLEGETYQSTTLTLETIETIDVMGKVELRQLDDPGHTVKRIENWVNWTPGTDDDRTTEWGFDSVGRHVTTTAKASGADQVTENVYGVVRGTDNSTVSSNELVYKIKYPEPDSGDDVAVGQPSLDVNDQEKFGYNALGELVWRKDQHGIEHTLDHDARGRLTDDRVTSPAYPNALPDGIDGTIRRISRTYDALDRPVLVTSVNHPTVGSGTVQDEVKFEYGPFSTVTKLWQEWTGFVTGSSPKVEYAYEYPTIGATGTRRTSTTYRSGRVINDVYSGTTNDALSRLSARIHPTDGTVYQDSFLGLNRLVERIYNGTYIRWTLLGTDTPNQDNYLGLDRFGRIDELKLKDVFTGAVHNDYRYTYNYRSQWTLREDEVGAVSGTKEFDETCTYDGLGRLTEHRRGAYSGGTMSPVRLDEDWTLDRSGNTTQFQVSTGGSPSTTLADFNASNEFTSRGGSSTYAEYDDGGNMTQKAGSTGYLQEYDAWNRLVLVSFNGSSMGRYRYNGLGRVIERTDSPSYRIYYYWGAEDQLLEEWLADYAGVDAWYVWGTQYIDDLVLFSDATSIWKFVAQDANFNVITRFDDTGSILRRYIYECYGLPKQLSANWSSWLSITDDMPLFTGRHYWKDHARSYYRNRVMDPGLMAWPQMDPLGLSGDPQSFRNGHLALGGSPLWLLDPTGEATCRAMLTDQTREDVEAGLFRWRDRERLSYYRVSGIYSVRAYDGYMLGAVMTGASIYADILVTAQFGYTSLGQKTDHIARHVEFGVKCPGCNVYFDARGPQSGLPFIGESGVSAEIITRVRSGETQAEQCIDIELHVGLNRRGGSYQEVQIPVPVRVGPARFAVPVTLGRSSPSYEMTILSEEFSYCWICD